MPTWFLTDGNDNFPAGGAGPPTNWTNTGEDVVNALGGNDTVNGGAMNDSLHGNDGNDTLNGDAGNDAMTGDAGNDTLNGGAGDDGELNGGAGEDHVNGGANNDTLVGGIGSDVIHGDAGNDTIGGVNDAAAAGDHDLLYGDDGNDTLLTLDLASVGATAIFDGGANTDTVASFGNLAGYTFVNVEVLDNRYVIRANVAQLNQFASITDHYANSDLTDIFLTSSGTIDFSTRIAADIKLNVQAFDPGSNTVIGGAKDDRMFVNFNAAGGSFVFDGRGGNDTLSGGAKNDTLIGGAGDDTLYGSAGIDTASYAETTAGVVVNLATGTATGSQSGTDSLSAIENVIGGSGNDQITGDGEANRLDGGAGADTMAGGANNDTYVVDNAQDRVNESAGQGSDIVLTSVNYTLQAGSDVEVLRAASASATTALKLTGNALAQRLDGNAGANSIDGKGGADLMNGLGGDDTYSVDNAGDVVNEVAGAGSDRVVSSISYALKTGQSIELFTTTNAAGTAALNLTGNDLAQRIDGNAGANTIDGKGGADTMNGGGGNDKYVVDNAGDIVNEAAGAGSDQVLTSISYTLKTGQSIELFTTTNAAATAALNLTGNDLAQTINGNAGDNLIDGKAGADTMAGFGGNDKYVVDNAGDVVNEAAGAGSDRVLTSASAYTLGAGQSVELFTTTNAAGTSALYLTGNELAQTINGNAGNNVINGKGGNDTLVGLGGADKFVFNTALGPGNIDHITDFTHGTDQIALENAVFTALPTPGALAAGAFFIGAAAHDADDRIIYNSATGALIYDANGNAAGGATQFATLAAHLSLTSLDFVVI